MFLIAKRFCSTGPGSGERARQVAEGETLGELDPSNVLMQKAGIETIPGPHWIYELNFRWGTHEGLRS
jgi:hypothetical protein